MFLGIDTSNYTTSVALFDGENVVANKKIMLSVKKGERGLRQSNALFQHTVNLPIIFEQLNIEENIEAVAVSSKPRNIEGSYMPCFLAGTSVAKSISKVLNCECFETSHQIGHILSAVYSASAFDFLKDEFLAFHISGGTTDLILVKPDDENIISAEIVASSSDLKAGQLIDRIGVKLGYDFPCGKKIDELASKSAAEFKIKPTVTDGNCSLSGVENKALKMIEQGVNECDVAKFVLEYIKYSLEQMMLFAVDKYKNNNIIFAGGVMSNSLISKYFKDNYSVLFAKPEFSCDNAVGTAVYAWLKRGKK